MSAIRAGRNRSALYVALFFLAIATIIMLPALKSGQLFLLDMPWPENIYLEAYTAHGISANLPLWIVLRILNYLIPAWLLQKLLLLGLLFLSGVGLYYLHKTLNKLSNFYALLGGTLYMLNPFVLDRLAAGQWLVLAGYAFLPVLARFAWIAYANPTKHNLAWALGVWAVYPIISVHWWYMATLFLLPVAIYRVYNYWRTRPKRHTLHINRAHIAVILAVGIWVSILGAYYSGLTSAVGAPDFQAFATRSADTFGAWGAVLSLRGFWYSGGTVPSPLELLWMLTSAGFVVLTAYAIINVRRRHPMGALYAGCAFVFAVILAVGYGSPISNWITDVVRHFVPGYSGLRETQKIAGLIAFAYSLAVPYAIWLILQKTKSLFYARIGIATGLCMYLLCMVFALNAIAPKLQPHRYPSDWKQVTETFYYAMPHRVLVLPWNGYIHLPFANNAFVANPAGRYFNAPTDTRRNSNNEILDNARGNSTFDYKVLSLKKDVRALTAVRAKDYDYILLMHTEDYESYKKQLDNADIRQVYSGPSLTLYNIKEHVLDQTF